MKSPKTELPSTTFTPQRPDSLRPARQPGPRLPPCNAAKADVPFISFIAQRRSRGVFLLHYGDHLSDLVKDMIRQASERAFLPSNRPRFVEHTTETGTATGRQRRSEKREQGQEKQRLSFRAKRGIPMPRLASGFLVADAPRNDSLPVPRSRCFNSVLAPHPSASSTIRFCSAACAAGYPSAGLARSGRPT